MRGVTPLRSIRKRERAHNFSAHFRVGRSACTIRAEYCQYCHATCRKLKLETAYHPQRAISLLEQIRMKIKLPVLGALSAKYEFASSDTRSKFATNLFFVWAL
jgi:hypothetical protein